MVRRSIAADIIAFCSSSFRLSICVASSIREAKAVIAISTIGSLHPDIPTPLSSDERSFFIHPSGERFFSGTVSSAALYLASRSFPLCSICNLICPFCAISARYAAGSISRFVRKYSINSLVYWVTYVHNVVYSFYRSMIYCYINSTQRCAGSIVIDIIPTNGADKRKFFPFAPYFPVTNVIKRYFYPYFPAIIGIKGYSFPYFPYLSGIMKIKTALYSLFSRLDWHKTVVFPCLGEIYEGIRSLSWEIPVT